jgi:hypothetical protein
MPGKVVSLRLPEELLDWATSYAETRGVARSDLLVEGLVSFREDCERGVPEIRQRVREVVEGVGSCPKHAGGHVWSPPGEDVRRRCVHCGEPGRGDDQKGESGHLAAAGAARAALFQAFKAPMQNGTGDAAKAYPAPKGMPPVMAAAAARVREDKSRRDHEANGSGPVRGV